MRSCALRREWWPQRTQTRRFFSQSLPTSSSRQFGHFTARFRGRALVAAVTAVAALAASGCAPLRPFKPFRPFWPFTGSAGRDSSLTLYPLPLRANRRGVSVLLRAPVVHPSARFPIFA